MNRHTPIFSNIPTCSLTHISQGPTAIEPYDVFNSSQ